MTLRLLEDVERTLAWGVRKNLCDKDLDAANKSFKDQYEQVNAYIKKYHPPKVEKLAWEEVAFPTVTGLEVAKNDRMAEGFIKKIKANVQTKAVVSPFSSSFFCFFEVHSFHQPWRFR